MALTGLPLLFLLVGATVLALAGLVTLWIVAPRPVVAWPLRVLCLLLVLVLPVAVTADIVNRDYGFYSSWADVANTPTDARLTAAAQVRHEQLPNADLAKAVEAASLGHGTVVSWTMPGPKSGITRSGLVYLPAAYFDKSQPTTRFPVIELLHGYSGSPANWTHAMSIGDYLDTEIAAGRMPPVIAVAPKEYDTNDGECVNAVKGEQNETYLAVDVPNDIAAAFRTETAPDSWATIGFSTGGFCAVNMALHHQSTYRAAVSLSGYFTALTDKTTGDLYRGNKTARLFNSPQWWVRHHSFRTSLYVFSSGGDNFSFKRVVPFRKAVPAGTDLTTVTVPVGGHNATTWRAALSPALDWIGQRLPAPTTPATSENGATSTVKSGSPSAPAYKPATPAKQAAGHA